MTLANGTGANTHNETISTPGKIALIENEFASRCSGFRQGQLHTVGIFGLGSRSSIEKPNRFLGPQRSGNNPHADAFFYSLHKNVRFLKGSALYVRPGL